FAKTRFLGYRQKCVCSERAWHVLLESFPPLLDADMTSSSENGRSYSACPLGLSMIGLVRSVGCGCGGVKMCRSEERRVGKGGETEAGAEQRGCAAHRAD